PSPRRSSIDTRASGRLSRISFSIVAASIAIGIASLPVEDSARRHVGGQPLFVDPPQLFRGYGTGADHCQRGAAGRAEAAGGNAGGGGEHRIRLGRGKQITSLILAEEKAAIEAGRGNFGADAARHRHLGERDKEAAIGEVVAGADPPGGDLAAHEIAVAALRRKVDGRRRAVLVSEN